MATCKDISITEMKPVVTRGWQLTLNEDEACVLYEILNRIGGDPSDSPRKFSDAIRAQLEEANVPTRSYNIDSSRRSIYFV